VKLAGFLIQLEGPSQPAFSMEAEETAKLELPVRKYFSMSWHPSPSDPLFNQEVSASEFAVEATKML
jgi:hypothetical protein